MGTPGGCLPGKKAGVYGKAAKAPFGTKVLLAPGVSACFEGRLLKLQTLSCLASVLGGSTDPDHGAKLVPVKIMDLQRSELRGSLEMTTFCIDW